MQAFLVDKYQKKVPLRLANVPEPTLGDGEVLIRIHAAGVSLLDAKIRDGAFKPILPFKLPLIRSRRVEAMRACRPGPCHLDAVYVVSDTVMHARWRAVDHDGEIL